MNICVILFSVVFATLHRTHASTYTSCTDAYSCEFSEKISPSDCAGYYSCAYSKLMEISAVVECGGSFSCYGISVINATSEFYLSCDGLYSCANVNNIGHHSSELVSNGNFACNGELSCFGSTFTNVSNVKTLYCDGDRACLNANVTLDGGIIYVNGYLGAANGTIKISDSGSSIKFVGMESGKNTTIICSGFETTCKITCYQNACDELRLIYDTDSNDSNNSNNNEFDIDCQRAFKSDVCPDSLDFARQLTDFFSSLDDFYNKSVFSNFSMPIIPSLYDNVTKSYTNLNNSIDTCEIGSNMTSIIVYEELLNNSDIEYDYVIDTGLNNEYPINCMDSFECQQNILKTNDFVDESIDSITVPICCTAQASCSASKNLNNTISKDDTNIGIRCDGDSSCGNDFTSNGTYMASNGNIYISGALNAIDITKVDGKNSDSSELFCNAADTCHTYPLGAAERKIENFKNIFCNSAVSCVSSALNAHDTSAGSILTFENIGNSIFFYGGISGGTGMKFNNIGNSVYCVYSSGGGCKNSIIENVTGSVYGIGVTGIYNSTIKNVTNIYGIGDLSMQYNTISNVENNVYFVGEQAGGHSTIRNAQNMVAIGDDALFNADISQVKTILISGSECLSGARISSNFSGCTRWSQSDRILTLKINCSVSYDFDVYCNKNDTCNIDCVTSKSCKGLNLHCDGSCNVTNAYHGSSSNDTLYIVIGCVTGGVILIIIILVIRHKRNKNNQNAKLPFARLSEDDTQGLN